MSSDNFNIQNIKKMLTLPAKIGCLINFVIFLFALAALLIFLLNPMMVADQVVGAVEDAVETVTDTVSDAVDGLGELGNRIWNFVCFRGFTTDEESFNNALRDEYEKYKEQGIIIDVRLIQSIVFYDTGVEENEDYECEIPEDADPNSEEFQECIPGVGNTDYDYAQLRNEVHELADGMVEDGVLKEEEEFQKWLKENFIEDKLKSLDYDIPESQAAKEKLFDEFIRTVYAKKGLYEELLGETDNNQCTTTQSPDEGSKQKARYTVYSDGPDAGTSLGATGDIKQYMKKGIIYINDKGYYMWKGGNKGRNGNVYGVAGQDYLIVAASINADSLMGVYSSTCKTTFRYLDDIRYFKYGDTFTVQVTTDGGKTYDSYNSIVLDACGACMLWSTSVDSPCTKPLSLVKETNNLKIDIYVHKGDNYVRPGDIGYFMDGTNSNVCIGTIDLGVLEVGTKGTKALNKPIEEAIGAQGINELNQQIRTNVDKYGRGTGNAVAAAAITLINGLKQQGYHLPYYYGGGHAQGITTGVDQKWGYPASKYDSTYVSTNASQGRTIYSYDCSAFVSWAMHNGGCPNKVYSTSNIANDGSMKKRKSISEAQPGDLLNDAGSHVMLVVQNNGGKVTLAESTVSGIQFSEATSKKISGYEIWDMSGYYKKYCQG